MDRLIVRIIYFIDRHTRWVFLFSLLLFALSIPFVMKLQLKLGFEDLLSEDSPSVKTQKKIDQIYGGQGMFGVVFQGGTEEQLISVVNEFNTRLMEDEEAKPMVSYVFYRMDENFLDNRILLYADLADLKEVERRLQKAVSVEIQNKSPFAIGEKQSYDFRLDDLFSKYGRKGLNSLKSPYFIDQDKKMIILFIKPTGLSNDEVFTSKFAKIVTGISNSLLRQDSYKGMRVFYGGTYYDLYIDRITIMNDIKKLSTLSVILISFLLYFTYRSFRSLVIVFYPLLLGVSLTMAFTYFTIGHLNMVTSFLASILLGTAMDFAIHIHTRYIIEKKNRQNYQKALIAAFTNAGSATIYAAITTAMGFFSLAFSHLRAFREFGVIAGGGIIISSLTIYFVLPVFIIFYEKLSQRTHLRLFQSPLSSTSSTRRLDFSSLFKKHSGFLRVIFVLLLVVLGYYSSKISFEYDFSKNRSQKEAEFSKVIVDFEDKMGFSTKMTLLLTQNDDLLKKAEAIYRERMSRGEMKTVDRIVSTFDIIPDQQEEKRAVLGRIYKTYLANKVAIDAKISEKGYGTMVEQLPRLLNVKESITEASLPPIFKENFFPKDGYKSLLISPKGQIFFDMRQQLDHTKELALDKHVFGDKITFGGINFMLTEILTTVFDDMQTVIYLIITTLLLFALIIFRSFKVLFLVLLNMVSVFVFTFGIMVLLGMKLTFLNIIVIPIIIGISVDNVIHICHAMEHERGIDPSEVINKIHSSIVLSAITTIAGFSVLLLSDYRGLFSMGAIASLGIFVSLIVALFFIPPIVPLVYRKNGVPRDLAP